MQYILIDVNILFSSRNWDNIYFYAFQIAYKLMTDFDDWIVNPRFIQIMQFSENIESKIEYREIAKPYTLYSKVPKRWFR